MPAEERTTPADRAPSGWRGLFSGANTARTLALVGGDALYGMSIYITTTILPSVVRDLGGLEYYAWNTALFIVASIVGSALSTGYLQRLGARGAYVVAAIVFSVGALVCAAAPSMAVLLVGRVIQGFGGGILVALPYAMIRIVFDEHLWSRAIALVSGMWGVATLLGPAVGGVFAEMNAWRAAFWSLVPAVGLFAVLAARALPGRSDGPKESAPIAVWQLALLASAVAAISVGSAQQAAAWHFAGTAVAVALIALLSRVENRANQRLLPRGALRLTSPLGALYATLSLLAVAVTSCEIFVPLFLQTLHGRSPLVAGYLAALMAGGWTVGSLVSSGVSGRRVVRNILIAPVLALAGMIALARLMPVPGDGSWRLLVPICLSLSAVGLAVGLAWPHLLTRVLQVAPREEQDLASASITTVQLFATALGAALAGTVVNLGGLTSPGGQAGTASAAFWLFAIFALAPVLCMLTALRVTGVKGLARHPN